MNAADIIVGIGGAAGDGVASAGNTLAVSLARQGLGVFAYNSYQSVIRGGHSWLRLRVAAQQPVCHGDWLDILVALNQDSLNRHFPELAHHGAALFNSEKVSPGDDSTGDVRLCPLPVSQLAPSCKQLPVIQNTVAVGALTSLLGLSFAGLEAVIESTFAKKGADVIASNVSAARAGYDYAAEHFRAQRESLASVRQPLGNSQDAHAPFGQANSHSLALVTGNELFALAAANAGCRFYCAYPMSPASGILHWMAAHGRQLGICVRQVEDEIAAINMTIGANHAGVRGMCATSGGGFALMTEAVGMAGMIETPVVVINVMRAGPSTGVPTKTEQADLNQALGASQGDFPRIIIAPTSIPDCYRTMEEAFNLADRYQCPVIVISDLLISESNQTVDRALLDVQFEIDRGELIICRSDCQPVDTDSNAKGGYLRYRDTPTGISPRAVPGVPDHLYVAATDEHDEDGVLLSDVYTDPALRKKMVDKRARKMVTVLDRLSPPQLEGPVDAEVTLVGWGSTWGVIHEAVGRLNEHDIATNHLQIKYLFPLHSQVIADLLGRSRKIIVVENNHSGQFARHLRAETGFAAFGHIRKYDGEPFEPKHIVAGVNKILAGERLVSVLSEETGWRTQHPALSV